MIKFITDALAEGKAPKKTVNDSVILRQGKEHKVLVSTAGNLTKAGRAYEELSGSELITFSFDTNQTPSRVGYGTILYNMVPYCTIWHHIVQYGTILYNMVPYCTIYYIKYYYYIIILYENSRSTAPAAVMLQIKSACF